MKHNRTAEASALLAEIEQWCSCTATPENHIGHVLFLHPGLVGLMRLRLTVSEEKEVAVRQFMSDHPNGWRGELPRTHANGTRPRKNFKSPIRQQRGEIEHASTAKLSEGEIAARRVDRDPCPRCGIRADVGCAHIKAIRKGE